jgi:hypothetical protein
MTQLPTIPAEHETIAAACRAVLETAEPYAKVRAARSTARAWRRGRLGHAFDTPMPDQPARPARPELLPPGRMPKRGKAGSERSRIAMLHALAHIEFAAIDLAFDMAGRFGAQGLHITHLAADGCHPVQFDGCGGHRDDPLARVPHDAAGDARMVLQLRCVEHDGLPFAQEVVHATVHVPHRQGDHGEREAVRGQEVPELQHLGPAHDVVLRPVDEHERQEQAEKEDAVARVSLQGVHPQGLERILNTLPHHALTLARASAHSAQPVQRSSKTMRGEG